MKRFETKLSAFIYGYGSAIDFFGSSCSRPDALPLPGFDQDARNFVSDRRKVERKIQSIVGEHKKSVEMHIKK